MAEDKKPPGPDTFIKGVLSELQSQTKKLVVSKLLVFGGLALSGIMGGLAAWLRSTSDLERGMLWGGALTLAVLVLAIVVYGAWLHLRSRKPVAIAAEIRRARRKKSPTQEDYREHAAAIAEALATADQLTAKAGEVASFLQEECQRRGVDLNALPEDLKRAVVVDYLLGPRAPQD